MVNRIFQSIHSLNLYAMELKLFVAENPQLAESQVNDWLQTNPAKVHHVGQSQSEKNGRFLFVISIYYSKG